MINLLLAQKTSPLGGYLEGLGPLGDTLNQGLIVPRASANLFTKTLSVIIGFLTVVAGIWFVFQFFIGAFSWLTAGSDKAALEKAQKTITNSLIGLVIIVAAIFIIDIIGKVIGLEILNPGKFLLGIW